MELENQIKKANLLTDYKITLLESEKIMRESQLNFIREQETHLAKWEKAVNAYVVAVGEEVKRLSKVETVNGIEVIR